MQLVRLKEEGVIIADVKAKQQVSSRGLGSGSAPEFCARPTSPLSRSIIHQSAVCPLEVFCRREHGLRLLEELSAPVLNTTQILWPNAAVSHCITIKSLATERNNTSRQTVYVSKRHRLHGPERAAASTGRLSRICNKRRCCATSLRQKNVRIQHTHQANNASDAVNVLRPSTRLLCYCLNISIRARSRRWCPWMLRHRVEITLGLFGRFSTTVPPLSALQGTPGTQLTTVSQYIKVSRSDRATATRHRVRDFRFAATSLPLEQGVYSRRWTFSSSFNMCGLQYMPWLD